MLVKTSEAEDVAFVLAGMYSAKRHGESDRIKILWPGCACASVVDAVQPTPWGVRVSPLVTPVRSALPSLFCVTPEKETNSDLVVCGSIVP